MSNIQIVMASGRLLTDLSEDDRRKAYAAFVEAYYMELKRDVETKPDEYAWPDKSTDEVRRVVVRMMNAVYHGSANNSNALKRAAKRMGLNGAMKYTEAFVRQALGLL